MTTAAPRLDAKLLYRRLDSLLGGIDPRRASKEILKQFVEEAFATLREDLRLRGAVLYREGRDSFDLVKAVGAVGQPLADTIDPESPAAAAILNHRVYLFDDPLAADAPFRLGLLPECAAAGLVVGRRPKRDIIVFLLDVGWVREELDFALNTIRAALGARIGDERVRGSFKEAAKIQASLLVEEPPEYLGYDIAFRTQPAEEVGGDFYDFLPFGDELLGVAIGDASGHGLTAALLVRDVVTGLRMGLEKDLKITNLLTKLNRVIHRSTLSSRFVSLFYGELEPSGTLIYVNAGHQPPMLFSDGASVELNAGGTVIGPLPDVKFSRGVERIKPGDSLVLSTDGIVERRNKAGDFFGTEGIERVLRGARPASAKDMLSKVFAAAETHGHGKPWDDDATLVVIRRTE